MQSNKFILAIMTILGLVASMPIPSSSRYTEFDTMTYLISDNDIDFGTGIFGAMFSRAAASAARSRSGPGGLDVVEAIDEDWEEYNQVVQMHDGRRGWGYSARREMESLKF
jgi:hypothetical protein